MEVTGKIKVIMDKQEFDSGFYKREFVITTEEQYPQDLKFELFKERSDLINDYNVGDRISVSFDLRGSEWQGRYFVNLAAWKIVAAGADVAADGPPDLPTIDPVNLEEEEEDDLPF